jgi:hypothetical protein
VSYVKSPLLSLIALISLIAIDLAVFRSIVRTYGTSSGSGRHGALLLLGLLPTLSLAVVGMCSLALAIHSSRLANPFVLGFVATSILAALAFVVACSMWLQPAVILQFAQGLAPRITTINAPTWVPIVLAAYALAVSAPQTLVAIWGGWLFYRFGISIGRLDSPGPENRPMRWDASWSLADSSGTVARTSGGQE